MLLVWGIMFGTATLEYFIPSILLYTQQISLHPWFMQGPILRTIGNFLSPSGFDMDKTKRSIIKNWKQGTFRGHLIYFRVIKEGLREKILSSLSYKSFTAQVRDEVTGFDRGSTASGRLQRTHCEGIASVVYNRLIHKTVTREMPSHSGDQILVY